MPVSVVCEATANVNAALRESLGSANACTVTSAAVGDDVKAAIVSANGATTTTITNTTDVCDSLQNKLVASAKLALFTKIEYEEATNYSHSVLDNLKSKYNVLKSSLGYNGEINRNSQMTIYNQSENSSADINGNTTATTTASGKLRANANELPQPKRILYLRENVQIGWEATGRAWKPGVGMINVGNTCYLNSTLQALFHVPSMANWLMSDAAHVERCDTTDTGCIICAMIKTLLASQNNISSIRPYCVYTKLKSICKHMVMGRQEDAHEFLRYLVEAMEKAYLSRFRNFKELDQFSKETTPLNQILGGYLKSAVRCLACNHISVTFQHFQDLLLDIRKADTIEEALEGYFSRERLEDMGYKCEACKKKVSATKQFTLERAPIVLCIQLKRFSMLGTKLNKQITLTTHLDLTKYASKQRTVEMDNRSERQPAITYRLVAMVTHLGASQHCGHYTAIGLTKSGTYYNYDDSYVRPISVQNVCNTNAYIIFYEMDSQPQYTVNQQQQSQQQKQKITCTQISGNSNNNSPHDNAQTIKMNGHPSVSSNYNSDDDDDDDDNDNDSDDSSNDDGSVPQRIIGPQLPPSKLGNYIGTAAAATTTTNTSINLLANTNKLGVNLHCSNSLLPTSAAPSLLNNISNNNNNNDNNNSKIMIHFKNNNNSNITNTTTVNSMKISSTTTCSTTLPSDAASTIISASIPSINNNNNNSSQIIKKTDYNNPASYNYNGHYTKAETTIKTAAAVSTKLLMTTTTTTAAAAAALTTVTTKLNSNQSSFCSSSDDDEDADSDDDDVDDENEQTSSADALASASTAAAGSQNTLPSMPKLNLDAIAAAKTAATTTTTTTSNLSPNASCNSDNNQKNRKPALTNDHTNHKKSTSASLNASPSSVSSSASAYSSNISTPFKSLVPYGSSETDEENDYTHASLGQMNTNQSLQQQQHQPQQKRLQSTMNPLKRRLNSINSNQLLQQQQQQQQQRRANSNSSYSGNGSNSDQDADGDDDDDGDGADPNEYVNCNSNKYRLKAKQKKITEFSVNVAKRKVVTAPSNPIDEIFGSIKRNSSSGSNSSTAPQTNTNLKYMKKSSKCLEGDKQPKAVTSLSSGTLPMSVNPALIPPPPKLSSSSSEEDNDVDNGDADVNADAIEDKSTSRNNNTSNNNRKISALKRSKSPPPSPPLIKTKTGIWQVTVLSPEILKKSNNKTNSQTKTDIENKTGSEKSSSKYLRNPFATNTPKTATLTNNANRSTATSKANNLNMDNSSPVSSKRLKKDEKAFSTISMSASTSNLANSNSNTKQLNGYGYRRESASDSAIHELLKQSHQGYGAPVLTWNGQPADIEKEIRIEARAERQREWQKSDEDRDAMGDNRNGRQKKSKNSRNSGIGGGDSGSGSGSGMSMRPPPSYNPFQEHQENLKRWKQRYQQHQHHNHAHHHNHNQYNQSNARHYNNHLSGTASASGHLRRNFQRNKFTYNRFPCRFTPSANINRRNNHSTNGSSGGGNNNNDCGNNNNSNSTTHNNLNYRRDS